MNSNLWLGISVDNVASAFKKHEPAGVILFLNSLTDYTKNLIGFIEKYDKFLNALENKFNIHLTNTPKVLRTKAIEVVTAIGQMKLAVAQQRFDITETTLNDLKEKVSSLKLGFEELSTLPQRIDYSALTNQDWRLIGVPGIHYKAKIFLSYRWREKDPKKDENEAMIDNYVKPVLALLNIIPVTLRDHLKAQDDQNEIAKDLIGDADGIIGFYTKGDSVANIEHELSMSNNLVAICTEIGANTPSMRRGEWQLEFKRDEMVDLIMGLMKALKDKQLFRLML